MLGHVESIPESTGAYPTPVASRGNISIGLRAPRPLLPSLSRAAVGLTAWSEPFGELQTEVASARAGGLTSKGKTGDLRAVAHCPPVATFLPSVSYANVADGPTAPWLPAAVVFPHGPEDWQSQGSATALLSALSGWLTCHLTPRGVLAPLK